MTTLNGIKRLLRLRPYASYAPEILSGLMRLELARARMLQDEARARVLSQAKEALKKLGPKQCGCGRVINRKAQRCRPCSNRERGMMRNFVSPFERQPAIA